MFIGGSFQFSEKFISSFLVGNKLVRIITFHQFHGWGVAMHHCGVYTTPLLVQWRACLPEK